MNLVVRPAAAAAADLEGAFRYYEAQRAGLGNEFLVAVEQVFGAVSDPRKRRGRSYRNGGRSRARSSASRKSHTSSPIYGEDNVQANRACNQKSRRAFTRLGHIFVRAGNQKVLLFGGWTGKANVADTWLYEPTTTASYASTGAGCPGRLGVPELAAEPCNLPWLGATFRVRVTKLPSLLSVPSFLLIGATDKRTLGFLGRPGCTLRTSLVGVFQLAVANNQATWSIAIPNNNSLLGSVVYNQVIVLDPLRSRVESLSNVMAARVGTR